MKSRYILIPVLILAAALRLFAIDLIDFRFDEASAVRFALAIARGQWLAALPFTGSVANHPPLYAYALALPAALAPDVLVIAVFRVFLDVLAVALCCGLCLRYFSLRAAVVAGLAFTCAPWAVLTSRNLGVVVLPLFSAVFLFGLLEAVVRQNRWGWAVAGWGAALCLGSHLTAVYLLPVAVVGLILGFRSFRQALSRPAPLLVGLAPCLVLVGVYAQYDAARDFANIRALLAGAGGPAEWNLDALWRAVWLTGGAHISDLTDGAFAVWQSQVAPALAAIDPAQMALLVVAVLVAPWLERNRLRPRRLAWVLLLAWCAMPIALQLRHSQPIQMHYVLTVYPAPFVLAGLAADGAIAGLKRSRWTARGLALGAIGSAIGLIAAWQVLSVVRFAGFVEQHDTSAGGYGLPVRNARAIALQARDAICGDAACNGPRDVIVAAPGGDPLVDEQATVMDALLAAVPHRFANSAAGLILRSGAAQYVFTPGAGDALERLTRRVQAVSLVTSTLPARVGSALRYTRARVDTAGVGQAEVSGMVPAPEARWDNGAALIGYRAAVDASAGVAHVETLLRIERMPAAGDDYHWFNHVLAGEAKVAQLDGGGIHPSNWRVDDRVWQWFDIPLPDDASRSILKFRIGSYFYPSLSNIPVTANNNTYDSLTLPTTPQP